MLLLHVAIIALHNWASTPQQTAVQAIDFGVKKQPLVRRVNVVGPYAAVLTSGGMMEGTSVTAPILVQRFSFGWQALDLLNDRCSLDAHMLGLRAKTLLMRGMPKFAVDHQCGEYKDDGLKDSGPHSDVEAVRRLMRGPLVPYVIVSGNWAVGEWYGAGGGDSLFKGQAGRWRLIVTNGGAMGVDQMRKYGVPQNDWCRFGIYNAKCH